MAAYLAASPMAKNPAQHPRKQPPKRRSAFRRIVVPILAWGFALAIVAALGVGLAVAFRLSSLPGYQELRRSPQGQSVVIRAADGTELVTVGPSYGDWLRYQDIPPAMVDAMKSIASRSDLRRLTRND